MGYTNSNLVTYKKISSNKTSPRKYAIDTITIHCIVGQWTAKQGCDYFASVNGSSANYVVGKDGSIGLCVEEKDRAWTSGGKDKNGNPIRVNGISGSDNDHRAITIEVASDTTHPYAVTDKALDALIELVADICERNNIKELKWSGDKSLVGKVDKQNMTVHRWFANKACPGQYLYDKHPYIAEQVNKKLGVSSIVTPSLSSSPSSSASKAKTGYAKFFSKSVSGTYKTTTALNMRNGAGTSYSILTTIPKGGKVTCYGYYTSVSGTKWFYVAHKNYVGFVSSKYLTK